jgi:hypothetical protein
MSGAMEMVAEVAVRLGKVPTLKAATEARATEMTPAEAAAETATHMMATTETAADMTATAEATAHMTATTETAAVSTSTAPARKRVGGQSPGESGSRQQHDHGLA